MPETCCFLSPLKHSQLSDMHGQEMELKTQRRARRVEAEFVSLYFILFFFFYEASFEIIESNAVVVERGLIGKGIG
ncbi:hypothetical protein CROQUDRAFT_654089 [Cronartium quercuum f. sp. fusiforme G11]|uniref:Uncharacterized protein n=1 Tax=Cronartium quercuum f. sp. fusiforme G11 TaxID=708437 RepID=A0A9P6NN12_9BASI|nr:hypothetical protein CROQUDRAFT_654089 [Cronartium quercuum f. sp. fusiforme G11]